MPTHRFPLFPWLATAALFLSAVITPCASAAPPAAAILYVDQAASGTGTGSSWTNAYPDLHDALAEAATIASPTTPVEIWVAQGLYQPDRGTGDRIMAFELRSNVSLYGGFCGGETALSQRISDQCRTILSGDLATDDVNDPIATADCCNTENAIACTDAWCNQRIAEYYDAINRINSCALSSWTPFCATLANAVCCDLCRPSRCENSYNIIRIQDTDSTPVLDGFVVAAGEANGLIESNLFNEEFRVTGGGLFARSATPAVRGCEFRSNYGAVGSGGMSVRDAQDLIISDCKFLENDRAGLGIDTLGHHVDIRRTVFAENTDVACSVSGIGGTAHIEDSLFVNNPTLGLFSTVDAIAIVRTDFVNNQHVDSYGGAVRCWNNATFVNCTFRDNHSGYSGGGIDYDGFLGGELIVADCLFDGNTAGLFPTHGNGGAVSVLGQSTIINSLLINNYAGANGGAIFAGGDTTTYNTIFWNNNDFQNGTGSMKAQFGTSAPTSFTIDHSIIEGWDGSLGGVGNSGVDPLFVDPLGPDMLPATGDENYRLSFDSPAIDAGHPNPPLLAVRDLDGHHRTLCAATDLGPYEFGIADSDCDGDTDLSDYFGLPACLTGPIPAALPTSCHPFDFNADDAIDLSDLAGFQNTFHIP